jgi:hypothetical protein
MRHVSNQAWNLEICVLSLQVAEGFNTTADDIVGRLNAVLAAGPAC